MNSQERKIQALKLIDGGRGKGLTDLANILISRQVDGLLGDGLICYDAKRRVGYVLTDRGRQQLAAQCCT